MVKGKLFELIDNHDYMVAVKSVRGMLEEAKHEFDVVYVDITALDWFIKYFGDE